MAVDVAVAAQRLRDVTGEVNPQAVGAVDGTEDDFGDLINEAFDAMVGVELDFTNEQHSEAWDRVQEAASEFEGDTMEEFCRMVAGAWYNDGREVA